MPLYLVNKRPQAGGEHEVHEIVCSYLPEPHNREQLGYHANCQSAVAAARRRYTVVDGCKHCIPSCHRR